MKKIATLGFYIPPFFFGGEQGKTLCTREKKGEKMKFKDIFDSSGKIGGKIGNNCPENI
jgi:hypothetical protein